MKARIAQISDIHIGPEAIRYNGIDVRGNFLRVLEDVASLDVDHVILSGDLAIDMGEMEAYLWIRDALKDWKTPVHFMSGNHDSVQRMSSVFGLEKYVREDMLFYQLDLAGHPVFFLDSEPDSVNEVQLKWLEECQAKLQRPALLFLHHPPCHCGHLFMDRKYPMHNIVEVQSYLSRMDNVPFVFCGHYHFEKKLSLPRQSVYVCPSTQMQISSQNKDFEISDFRPGWRLIEWDGQDLSTEVRYVTPV
jgi:3',5'-cyclic-AMP phosphodiesterase